MNRHNNNSFLGIGWSFPPVFLQGSAAVEVTEGEADIKRSLEVLLTTNPGERILYPQYGCTLFLTQFDTVGPSIQTDVTEMIRTAIEKFEPRVKLENVELVSTELEGKIEIHIYYEILQTNTTGNLVFPFYTNTGATLP